jgi:hypothetical protein
MRLVIDDIKIVIKDVGSGITLESSSSEQDLVVSSCTNDRGPWDSIEDGEFIH